MGKPIAVPPVSEPTHHQVTQYHDLYLAELERIYHAHKADCGYDGVPLTLVK